MATNEMETENINQTTPLDDTHAVIPLAVLLFQLQLQLPVHIQSQLLSPSSRPHLPLPGFAAQLQLQQLDYRQVLLPSNPVLGPLVTDVCRPTFRTLLLTTILQLPAEQMNIAL